VREGAIEMQAPKKDEYEAWEGGVRHMPTGTRIKFDYRNERGEWTFGILKGVPGPYIERAVEELGAQILLDGMYQLDKLSELRSELMQLKSGNMRRREGHGDGRMVDVSDKRIAELERQIAQIEKTNKH
jgi:hypothetical protein